MSHVQPQPFHESQDGWISRAVASHALKYIGSMVFLVSLAGCATSPSPRDYAAVAAPSWTVSRSIAVGGYDLMRYCLTKHDGKWVRSENCNEKQNSVEILYLNPWQKQIFLGALAPRDDLLSTHEKESKQYRRDTAADSWECYYGAFGTADRVKHGYSVCSSTFTKGVTGVGDAVVGNVFNAVFGTIRKRVAVDTDAVNEAVQQADLIVDSYRQVFASAKTPKDLERFIQRYREEDPDNLVPKATEAMAQAQEAENAKSAEKLAEAKRRQEEYEKQQLANSRSQPILLAAASREAKVLGTGAGMAVKTATIYDRWRKDPSHTMAISTTGDVLVWPVLSADIPITQAYPLTVLIGADDPNQAKANARITSHASLSCTAVPPEQFFAWVRQKRIEDEGLKIQEGMIEFFEHKTGHRVDRLLICRGQKANSSPWNKQVQFHPPGFHFESLTANDGTWARGAFVNLTGVFLLYGGPTSSGK